MTRLCAADVTVVVPAYRAAATIAEAVKSLLSQTVGSPRVIVVDDGSDDATAAVSESVGAEVIQRLNGGPGAARNTGVRAVESPFLAFCDADDRWPADRLALDLDHFQRHPDTELLLGRTRFDADDGDLLKGMHFEGPDRSALIPHFGAVTMRRAAFDAVGPINELVDNYEDYDWFLLARERRMHLVVHDRVTLHRRVHRGSTSQMNPGSTRDLLSTLQRSVRRRHSEGFTGELPSLRALRTEST